jgi:hypothetical protein
MNSEEYSRRAHATALYPTMGLLSAQVQDLIYPVLGLANEYLEFHDKVKKDALPPEIILEGGDVFWYANEISLVLGLPFKFFIEEAKTKMTRVKESQGITCIGSLTGIMKKMIRDGPSPEKTNIMIALTTDLMAIVLSTCPSESIIMDANIDKLEKRMKTNTIKGDGDHR